MALGIARVVLAEDAAPAAEPSDATPPPSTPQTQAPASLETKEPETPAQPPHAASSPLRTAVPEASAADDSEFFFLHNDNFFALNTNGGTPPRVKFQISVRFEMISLFSHHNFALNFAYTQKSFWDLFAFNRSSPFVENNYKPELFVSYRPHRREHFRELQLGVQHESDGLGRDDLIDQSAQARGWNNVFLEGRWGIRRDTQGGHPWLFFTPGLRVWVPFTVFPSNIVDHLGYFAAFLDVDLHVPQLPVARVFARVKVRQHNAEVAIYYPYFAILSGGRIRPSIFIQVFRGQAERLITFDQTVTNVYAGLGFR
jgi:outer membrane phospholipase A